MPSGGGVNKGSGVEWGLWANEHAVISSIILFFGGILGVAGMFENWQFAASVIPASFIIFLIEWPRGSRMDGKQTKQRRWQNRLSVIIDNISPLRNYIVRAVLMLIVSVPSCFLLPTILGGLCLMVASLIYLTAAINREGWKPMSKFTSNKTDLFPSPPSNPPPRNLMTRDEVGQNRY